MYKYIESVHAYNSSNGEFKRFGNTEWRIYYTAKAIIVNGRYLPLIDDAEFSYRLRRNGVYSMYSPKEFCRQFFKKDRQMDVWCKNICHHVFRYGKQVKGMQKNTLWYINNDTPFDMRPYEQVACNLEQAKGVQGMWLDDYKAHGYNIQSKKTDNCHCVFSCTKGSEEHKVTIKEI